MSGDLREREIERRYVHAGRMIRVRVDRVELSNGRETTREVVEHPGAVAILAETEAGELILVRQYRYAIRDVSLEIPAGKLEPGEDPNTAAQRELTEETGYTAGTFERLATFYTSPGFSNEQMTLYWARGLTPGAQSLDDDEFLEAQAYTASEIADLLRRGEVTDGKSLVGLLWWLGERR